jgi:hypothetical protein
VVIKHCTALQYVKLAFSDRMWPRECHAKNIERKSASWCDLVDIEVKWRFLTILRAILKSDRYARNIIPVSIVSLMYAEHVLRVPVDWSTLPSIGFGCLSEMYQTRKPTQIPYVAVPVWFRSDPSLLDDPESPIPANRKPWSRSRSRKKRRLSADNELDRDLGAAFAQMEMVGAREAMTGADGVDAPDGADGVSTGPDGVLTRPDGVLTGADGVADGPVRVLTGADGANGVSTVHDGVLAWSDGVEIRGVILVLAQEQSKLLADVAAYKARISFLESKLSELGFK